MERETYVPAITSILDHDRRLAGLEAREDHPARRRAVREASIDSRRRHDDADRRVARSDTILTCRKRCGRDAESDRSGKGNFHDSEHVGSLELEFSVVR